MYAKKSVSMKVVVLLLAVVLLVGCTIGGTIAYLTAKSNSVTNVFSVGNITITLDEDNTQDVDYKIVPGASQPKEPVVTVKEGSEKCYVYVSIINDLVITNENGQMPIVGTMDINESNWVLVGQSENEMVLRYYTVVDAASEDKTCTVFTRVLYATTITEDTIEQLNQKTIKVEAYAHQSEHVEQSRADSAACTYFNVTPYSEG